MLPPYYRRNFGQKYSSGFFIEGFGLLSSTDGKKIYETDAKLNFKENPEVIDFASGIGLTSKWTTKSGFIFEVSAGWSKPLFSADKTDHDQIIKLGFNVGCKF